MKNKKSINEGLFSAAKKFTDVFFDGLKSNATNKALETAKKNKKVPPKVIQAMIQIDELSDKLDKMLKDME